MHELYESIGLNFDHTRELLVLGLILARALPMMFMLPFMTGQVAPSEVKMGLGVMIAILVWPVARESMFLGMPTDAIPYILVMMKEVFVGFVIGSATSHMFSAMEVAGRLIDTARGAAMAEVMVATTRTRATVVGNLYQNLLIVFFLALGGHRVFFRIFFDSFRTLPIHVTFDTTPGFGPMVELMTRLTADIMMTATILAAPALAATFITDLVFGILNRVAPQLNAYFMAMPVKAMGALAMMLAGMPAFLGRLSHYMESSLVAAQQAIDALAPR